jgi:hypothetical protein
MTPEEQAKALVNDQFYQPLTQHLNLTNSSKEMWDYAKRCAKITVMFSIQIYEKDQYKRKTDFLENTLAAIDKL